MTKIVKKSTQGHPKNPKMAKESSFLRGRFFDEFWVAKKMVPRGHAHFWPFGFPAPGLLWGVGGNNTTTQ